MLGGILGETALTHQIAGQSTDRRQPSRDAGRLEAIALQSLEVGEHFLGTRTLEPPAGRGQEGREMAQVAAVGRERVG
jgi:hypothetical protein